MHRHLHTPLTLLCALWLAACQSPTTASNQADASPPPEDTPAQDTTPDTIQDAPIDEDVPPPRTVEPRQHIRSWILLSDDPRKVSAHLEAAPRFGVQEVQLSHGLIRAIDDLNSERRQTILDHIAAARAAGLRVVVWANEFNDVPLAVCFDPNDPVWQARRDAYDQALNAAAELDGVVLSFGSADPPPWFAGCVCEYCQSIPQQEGSEDLRPFFVPHPAERVRQVVENVHDVVTGQHGRYVYLRTFIHQPEEARWMQEGLAGISASRYLVLMSKDVPNDWQPYYPLNPAIGAVPDRPALMELDAAGEYWGLTQLPFAAVGYFERRIHQARPKGLIGYAARVERGSHSALGTPNEVNLQAIATFFDDPQASPTQVYAQWLPQRYDLPQDSELIAPLTRIHQRTFDVGRKMYYQSGFWTLNKGSGLPERCLTPALLQSRNTAKWNPAYQDLFEALQDPTPTVLAQLRQEDLEAISLAEQNLADFDQHIGPEPQNAALRDLRTRLERQRSAVHLWRWLVEALWSRALYLKDPSLTQRASWTLAAANAFDAALDDYQRLHGDNPGPVSIERARTCSQDLRQDLPGDTAAAPFQWPTISTPSATINSDGHLEVTVDLPAQTTATLQWGTALPTLPNETHLTTVTSGPHTFIAPLPESNTPLWIVYRITAADPQGHTIIGSDYWLRTR